MTTRRHALGALCAMGLAAAAPARAQAPYPNKPVKLLVGVAPGGAADFFARLFAQKAGESLGQNFLVDNRPGAGGTLAADVAAKAAPDGYTLLVSSPTVMVVAPYLYKQLGYLPARDFAPVALLGGGPLVLVVHPELPARNVAELLALARSRGEPIAFGSGGQGTAGHLTAEMFASMGKVRLLHAPYKGDGQAVTDLLGGQVKMMFTAYNLVEANVRAGKLRLLAVTSRARLAALPDVPTLDESGLKGFESLGWIGLFAQSRAPAEVAQRLSDEWQKIRRQPEVTVRFEAMGMNALQMHSPREFQEFIRAEDARWRKVIADAGVQPE